MSPPRIPSKPMHAWEGDFSSRPEVRRSGRQGGAHLCARLSSSWEVRRADLKRPQFRVSHSSEQKMMHLAREGNSNRTHVNACAI